MLTTTGDNANIYTMLLHVAPKPGQYCKNFGVRVYVYLILSSGKSCSVIYRKTLLTWNFCKLMKGFTENDYIHTLK